MQETVEHNQFDKNTFCPLVKVDEAKQEVWTVVTAQVPDREEECCHYKTTVPYYKELVAEMSKASDGKNIFPLREMHGLSAAGKGISIEFRDDKKEIYMGFRVVDPIAWKKVKEGVYTGVSQGGKYMKKWKEGDLTYYTAKPIEVSLVDLPCLPAAHFDFIRADGVVEIRKFLTRGTNMPASDLNKGCTCKCAECEKGECSSCSAKDKCSMSAKAVRYLVVAGGEKHLPVSDEDGKINHRLLGAAWAALHGGYRGNKYSGPNKEQAKKKLIGLYRREGLETPSEKSERVDGLVKTLIEDTIQRRAFGCLGKGLYTVGRLGEVAESIKYLWMALEGEREFEGDESPVTDDMKEIFEDLLDAVLDYTTEQIEEEREKLHVKSA